MAVAAAEDDKENSPALAPRSADGSSNCSFNNASASNSSCSWTKPIGSFPSERQLMNLYVDWTYLCICIKRMYVEHAYCYA